MGKQPKIIWDKGSAYDLFASLWILHRPEEFGLRPSWAAGVRSRLPMDLREVLECSQAFINVPLNFVYKLPQPKDASTALAALKALRPEERLPALVFSSRTDQDTREFQEFLLSLDGKQRLTAKMESRIKQGYGNSNQVTNHFIKALFEGWTNRRDFGEKFTLALEAYIRNFYEEEEHRIKPAQEKALDAAVQLSKEKDVISLLEELSSGVRLDWITEVSDIVLAPSFWGAPFVFFNKLSDQTGIVLYGARPEGTALVPGEFIPEELINALKALADPTRLRILYYLRETPATTSDLSNVLRLRPPTVIHHLRALRLAGLIQVRVSPEAERQYAIRRTGIDATIKNLRSFLPGD